MNMRLAKVLPRDDTVWSSEQSAIIECNASQRLIVDAGPGTGKTAVLCARIAWLIEELNVSPSDIWVISFTRTAVAELRDRVSKYLSTPEQAHGIRVATIDSHAWSLNSGFISSAKINGGFEENINTVINLAKNHEGVFEYLRTVGHLFVDESQDVVGSRVELLLEIIYAIPPEAGITVFCDEAQSIYGFADKKDNKLIEGTLPENIKKYFPSFQAKRLNAIHRTTDPVISSLFNEGRSIIGSSATGINKLIKIRKAILNLNHGQALAVTDNFGSPENINNDSFLLFRTRAEALRATNCLRDSPFRLRMSGMPHVVQSWIGIMFWDWVEPEQSFEDFCARWARRIPRGSRYRIEKSWRNLVQFFGISASRIDVRYMNRRLSSMSPPVEFCEPEFGSSGPIFGTIHTSKGREADTVHLYLPDFVGHRFSTESAAIEEAKVLFVGASRAKNKLYVGSSPTQAGRTIKGGGRAFQEIGKRLSCINLEIGRNKDINGAGLAGILGFPDAASAKRAQSRILSLCNKTTWATGRLEGRTYLSRFAIYSEEFPDAPIAFLSEDVNHDLRKIVRELRVRRHGSELKPITILGCRTIAIPEQSDDRQVLHPPWRDSGFLLAPLLTGFPVVTLSY